MKKIQVNNKKRKRERREKVRNMKKIKKREKDKAGKKGEREKKKVRANKFFPVLLCINFSERVRLKKKCPKTLLIQI